jgi:hypothetical protein
MSAHKQTFPPLDSASPLGFQSFRGFQGGNRVLDYATNKQEKPTGRKSVSSGAQTYNPTNSILRYHPIIYFAPRCPNNSLVLFRNAKAATVHQQNKWVIRNRSVRHTLHPNTTPRQQAP